MQEKHIPNDMHSLIKRHLCAILKGVETFNKRGVHQPKIKALGIDLAKLIFSIHGVDEHSKCKLSKTAKRNCYQLAIVRLLLF